MCEKFSFSDRSINILFVIFFSSFFNLFFYIYFSLFDLFVYCCWCFFFLSEVKAVTCIFTLYLMLNLDGGVGRGGGGH